MAVTTLDIPRHLTATKKRARNRKRATQNSTSMTVNADVKAWLASSVKSHWFLSQLRQQRKITARTYANDLEKLYTLQINFQDPRAAALFKLAWL